jgi:hypothetical protein
LKAITAEQVLEADEEAAAEAATVAGAEGATTEGLRAELAMVDDMLGIAEPAAMRPDARIRWLVQWIEQNMLNGGMWNERRLILFTEYEDTRRWLERRLREVLGDTDRAEERIDVFTGATGAERHDTVKRAFNANPATEPLRILICTDAAREGINLQTYCADLVHIDLPWNPSRLEQRNGRIDRKLQPVRALDLASEWRCDCCSVFDRERAPPWPGPEYPAFQAWLRSRLSASSATATSNRNQLKSFPPLHGTAAADPARSPSARVARPQVRRPVARRLTRCAS